MEERAKFGIQGLDKALNGGIPRKNIVLLSGGAGTGKSTLALQYLVNGAKTFGERGIYFSTEQTPQELQKVADQFGWKISELQKTNMLKIVHFDVLKSGSFLKQIQVHCEDFQPQRIVVDSVTTLTDSLLVSDSSEMDKFSPVQILENVAPVPKTERLVSKTVLYHLIGLLKQHNATVMLTSELPEKTDFLSADEVSEFICDGVILLKSLTVGESSSRTLQFMKMRYTSMDGGIKSYELGASGFSLEEAQ